MNVTQEDNQKMHEFGNSKGVLPLVIDNGETIICTAISGGANYINNMPAELRIMRELPDGTRIYRSYYQVCQNDDDLQLTHERH